MSRSNNTYAQRVRWLRSRLSVRVREVADPERQDHPQVVLTRPGQLLVTRQDAEQLGERLASLEVGARRSVAATDLVCCHLQPCCDVDAVADELQDACRQAGSQGRVTPNHVLYTPTGAPHYHGGPGSRPQPADRPGPPDPEGSGHAPASEEDGRGVKVGVIDTGILRDHPAFTTRNIVAPTGTDDVKDVDPADGVLDDQAGHGTFVTGVVLQYAPDAIVHVRRVLDSNGIGDEVAVAQAISELAHCDILNLSLGGYTSNDAPPLGLLSAINALPDDVVVVAAAGNDASTRPFWPAALEFEPDRVVAVAALDAGGNTAPFSNHGTWVDAEAVGDDVVSTFLHFDGPEPVRPDGSDPDRFRHWARWSGTSFAAPAVTGALAALACRDGVKDARAALELLRRGHGQRFGIVA